MEKLERKLAKIKIDLDELEEEITWDRDILQKIRGVIKKLNEIQFISDVEED